jgi:hypothetical protein
MLYFEVYILRPQSLQPQQGSLQAIRESEQREAATPPGRQMESSTDIAPPGHPGAAGRRCPPDRRRHVVVHHPSIICMAHAVTPPGRQMHN